MWAPWVNNIIIIIVIIIIIIIINNYSLKSRWIVAEYLYSATIHRDWEE